MKKQVLSLKKITVANLSQFQLSRIYGGDTFIKEGKTTTLRETGMNSCPSGIHRCG